MIKYTPAIPLSEFIDYLYVDLQPMSTQLLEEYGRPTNPLMMINAATHADFTAASKLKGVHITPAEGKQAPRAMFEIGVRFKPYGLFTGFGIEGEMVLNKIIPDSAIFPHSIMANIYDACTSGNFEASIELVHDKLYDQLKPNPILYEITAMTDALLLADLAKNSQRHLAQAFERTPKSFIGIFRRAVGTTPLNYLHICKVQQAKHMIQEQASLTITDIAHSLGFYDQAHFIRIFRKHTGVTPLQYRTGLQKSEG